MIIIALVSIWYNGNMINNNSQQITDNDIIWVDISTLKLWERNPNEGDVGAIMTSISASGFNDTCHLWHGVVKAGNHSVMALTNLRADGWHPDKCKIQSKCLKVDNGNWFISMIDISEMNELQSDAFGVAINKTQRDSSWNEPALAELLQELANSDEIDISASGYDSDDLDELLRDIDPANHVQFAEYDESIADTVEYHDCPNCGHKFPK